MTSNGLVLARKLPALKAAGLNLLNISLDTLDPLKFPLITRRDGFDHVMRSINLALEMGYVFHNIKWLKAAIPHYPISDSAMIQSK